MQNRRNIICGGATIDGVDFKSDYDLKLNLFGKEDDPGKLTLQIEDICRKMFKEIDPLFLDLLDIATYVYSADQAVTRSKYEVDTFGDYWRRELHFIVPVRNPSFWQSSEMFDCLTSTLDFLSDDYYDFTFVKAVEDHPSKLYLHFNEENQMIGCPDQVIMFSGGLDSLGGIIQESIVEKKKCVLVTHKSTTKLDKMHRDLQTSLCKKLDQKAPVQIGIRVHKNKKLNKEYTQRNRSFLYMSLGATIANMCGHSNLRFYENGVISLNLPVCAQVVGSRATRTTHPQVLDGFQKIISIMLKKQFTIENPFIWKTKAEVVDLIGKNGCADLIASSISCTHVWEMTTAHTHCGTCSQCIDRRFAVLAADVEAHDPVEAYKVDIFTQSNPVKEDKIMLATYLERANSVRNLDNEAQFISRYSEVCRVFNYLGSNPRNAAERVFDLYRRHAFEIKKGMAKLISSHSAAIMERTIPGDCITRLIYDSASVPCAPSVVRIDDGPDNYFHFQGEAWEIRFEGKKHFHLVNVPQGAAFLAALLSNPHQQLSASELIEGTNVDPDSILMDAEQDVGEGEDGYSIQKGFPRSAPDPVIHADGLSELEQRYEKLMEELQYAKQQGNEKREAQIKAAMKQLASETKKMKGLRGRIRQLGECTKNDRDSFANAVNRAIKKIEGSDAALAAHLRKFVKKGNFPIYRPDTDIVWDVQMTLSQDNETERFEENLIKKI